MSIPQFANPPIVILGAARSGTKMLRGLIAAGDGMHAVPYDVNFIWRYGNHHLPDDVIDPASCNDRIVRFIRRHVSRCAGMSGSDSGHLVEKTVSNILRLPFVATVLPTARYVILVRDGRDVVESAMRCWQETPNLTYLLQKCRTFPWLSCASYGWNFAKATAARFGRSKRRPTWGPRYPGIDQHAATLSLLEVCAHQWRCCMEQYDRHRDLIPADRRLEIHYERLVSNPESEIDRLADFLKVPADKMQHHAAKHIHANNVGKQSRLTPEQQVAVERLAERTLTRWGYERRPLVPGDAISNHRRAA